MKISRLLVFCMPLLVAGALQAQQIDAQFGISGINAPSATNFNFTSLDHSPQSLSGGVYPGFAADFLIWHNLGFNGEISWKASQGLYAGTYGYRPILYDFNAVYAKKVSRVGFALMGGIGAESIRFYSPSFQQCNGFGQCTTYISSNHLLGHVGGALRLYATHSVYIAPEIHFYAIHNNLEFTSDRAIRYGLNIGYTFGR
jgi:hypothetical protein